MREQLPPGSLVGLSAGRNSGRGRAFERAEDAGAKRGYVHLHSVVDGCSSARIVGNKTRHQRTRPYTPRHDGKAERYQRSLAEEVLCARTYECEDQRSAALEVWNIHYNYHRPEAPWAAARQHLDSRLATPTFGPPTSSDLRGRMNQSAFDRFIRPLADQRVLLLARLGGICMTAGGAAGVVGPALAWDGLAHPTLLLVVGVVTCLWGVWLFLWGVRGWPRVTEHAPEFITAALFYPPFAVTLAQIGIGPVGSGAVFYVVMPIFAYVLLSPSRAWMLVAAVSVLYGITFLVDDGYTYAAANWFAVMAAVSSTCYVFGGMLRTGVEESERSARLRHFLAPSVADAVLSGDQEAVLTPHRREIAVFFADLRGFTNFAARAEPEDVLGVLNEYYETVGAVLHQHGATIGDYIGDGIMAYLNDPLPVPDPAATAVQMATEARDALLPVAAGWERFGHNISFGMGVAYGHATLGVVGFSERHSYAPLGTVVNLSARLCSAADNGEVLVDRRAAAHMPENWKAQADHVPLKGLGDAVSVYRVPASVDS